MLDSWSNHYILSTSLADAGWSKLWSKFSASPFQMSNQNWHHGYMALIHDCYLSLHPLYFVICHEVICNGFPAATGSMAWRTWNGQPTGLCLCYWRDTGSRPKGRGTTLYVTAVFCMLRVQNTPCFFLSCVNSSLCLQMLCRSWNSLHATRSRKGRCSSISSAAQDDSRMKWKSWFPALEVYPSSRGVSNCF